MPFLTDLDEVLRERGVKVQTHAGWKTRGYNGWGFAAVRGTLWHHTATNRAAFANNPAPTVELCKHGRSDLPGPLCQIVLDRNGVAHVIAAGWGNHAGPGAYPGIPRDQGNQYLIGVEMESSGVPPYDWTLAQLQAIPILRDALRDGYGHKLDIGHMEWSSMGKIDPAGLPGGMNWLRTAPANATIKAAASTITKDWFDMASEADLRNIVREELRNVPGQVWGYKNKDVEGNNDAYHVLRDTPRRTWAYKNEGVTKSQAYSHLVYGTTRLDRIIAQNAALEAAVSALAESKGIDPANIERAVTDAVARALSDVSITLTNATVEEEAK